MDWLSGGEPTLDEMMLDPTIITMMKRDRVKPDDVRRLLRQANRRLVHGVSRQLSDHMMPPGITRRSVRCA
jgi:hypothetical protein